MVNVAYSMWAETELNRRHMNFQFIALPTVAIRYKILLTILLTSTNSKSFIWLLKWLFHYSFTKIIQVIYSNIIPETIIISPLYLESVANSFKLLHSHTNTSGTE